MSGEASPTSQTMQTSSSTSSPNPYIQPALQDMLRQLDAYRQDHPSAPGYYPGGTVAARSPADLSTRNTAWQRGVANLNNIDAAFDPSIRFLSDAASGKLIGEGDDIMARKLDAMFRPQNEQFVNLVAPSLQATFGSAGRPGGGLEWANLRDQFKSTIGQTQSDAAAKAAADQYARDMGVRMSGATALPGVLGQKTGQDQSWLGVLDSVGRGDTGYNQALLNDQNAEYDYGNRAQLDWLTSMMKRYLGGYPGGQTTGSSSGFSTGTLGGGGVGSWLGPAASIAGTAAMFF